MRKLNEEMVLVNVAIAEIAEDFNPRVDFGKVDEIAKSIEAMGLLQPIVVRKAAGNKTGYVLVDGACRLRALKKLGQKETQVRVLDIADAGEAQMAANLMRSDLNWLERARGYANLISKNKARYSAATVSRIFGEKKAAVERWLAFAEKWDPALDAKLSPFLENLREDGLKMMVQIPKEHQARYMDAFKGDGWDAPQSALDKAFYRLDHSDVFGTEAAASAKGGFKVNVGYGPARSYTTDEALYKKVKAEYEAARKKKYGSDQAKDDKTAKKSRQLQLQSAAKRRKKAEAARKVLKSLVEKFLRKPATASECKAAARWICDNKMNTDEMRQIFSAWGIKEKKSAGYDRPGGKAFDAAFDSLVSKPEHVVKLHALMTSVKYAGTGPGFAEQLVSRAKK